MKDDQEFFVAGKAFIEKDGKILILFSEKFGMDFPGGKLKVGEDSMSALKREVKEETGFTIKIGKPFCTWIFEIPKNSGHPKAGRKVFSIGYFCSWVSGRLKLSKEHDRFAWVTRENYKKYSMGKGHVNALQALFE